MTKKKKAQRTSRQCSAGPVSLVKKSGDNQIAEVPFEKTDKSEIGYAGKKSKRVTIPAGTSYILLKGDPITDNSIAVLIAGGWLPKYWPTAESPKITSIINVNEVSTEIDKICLMLDNLDEKTMNSGKFLLRTAREMGIEPECKTQVAYKPMEPKEALDQFLSQLLAYNTDTQNGVISKLLKYLIDNRKAAVHRKLMDERFQKEHLEDAEKNLQELKSIIAGGFNIEEI